MVGTSSAMVVRCCSSVSTVGRAEPLASAPTLSRLETGATPYYAAAQHEVLMQQFIASHAKSPKELVLDVFAIGQDRPHDTGHLLAFAVAARAPAPDWYESFLGSRLNGSKFNKRSLTAKSAASVSGLVVHRTSAIIHPVGFNLAEVHGRATRQQLNRIDGGRSIAKHHGEDDFEDHALGLLD